MNVRVLREEFADRALLPLVRRTAVEIVVIEANDGAIYQVLGEKIEGRFRGYVQVAIDPDDRRMGSGHAPM